MKQRFFSILFLFIALQAVAQDLGSIDFIAAHDGSYDDIDTVLNEGGDIHIINYYDTIVVEGASEYGIARSEVYSDDVLTEVRGHYSKKEFGYLFMYNNEGCLSYMMVGWPTFIQTMSFYPSGLVSVIRSLSEPGVAHGYTIEFDEKGAKLLEQWYDQGELILEKTY